MRITILKTVLVLNLFLGAAAVMLLFQTMMQIIFSQMTSLEFIARLGITFLTLVICLKSSLEIDKKIYN